MKGPSAPSLLFPCPAGQPARAHVHFRSCASGSALRCRWQGCYPWGRGWGVGEGGVPSLEQHLCSRILPENPVGPWAMLHLEN